MIPFHKQIRDCHRDGFHAKGEFLSFENFKEYRPAFPFMGPYNNSLKGIDSIKCLRFGGHCHSGHPQCREMREFLDI